jgi:hypothetical protein
MLSTEDKLADFTALNGYYTIPILGLIGFCTNLICLLVMFSPRFKKKDKYYYVIVKIVIEASGCLYFVGFQVKFIFLKYVYKNI